MESVKPQFQANSLGPSRPNFLGGEGRELRPKSEPAVVALWSQLKSQTLFHNNIKREKKSPGSSQSDRKTRKKKSRLPLFG